MIVRDATLKDNYLQGYFLCTGTTNTRERACATGGCANAVSALLFQPAGLGFAQKVPGAAVVGGWHSSITVCFGQCPMLFDRGQAGLPVQLRHGRQRFFVTLGRGLQQGGPQRFGCRLGGGVRLGEA